MASRLHPRCRRTALAVTLIALAASALPSAASADYTPRTQRIADDFSRDDTISPCRHSAPALRAARAEVAADPAQGAAGLLGAIEAAIATRGAGTCEPAGGAGDADEQGATAAPTPDPGAAASPTPAPGAVPTPAPGAAVPPGSEAPAVPTVPGGSPAAAATPAPAPAPTATTPAPATTPAAPAPAGDGVPALTWILAGAALLLALLAGLSMLLSRGRRGDERFARTSHMWREAGDRLGAAWVDFAEWLRLGR